MSEAAFDDLTALAHAQARSPLWLLPHSMPRSPSSSSQSLQTLSDRGDSDLLHGSSPPMLPPYRKSNSRKSQPGR
jgi:hypothetical protein